MKAATSLVFCSLLLFSCGDKAPKGSGALPDVLIDEKPSAGDDQPVELTDKLMEQYIEIARELKKASNAGNVALLARYGWSMERWSKVAGAVAQGMASAGRAQMSEIAKTSGAEFDKSIADLTARLKTAPEAERETLKAQIQTLEASRASLAALGHASDLDRRNAAVLERWKPKLEALGNEK